MFRPRRGAIVEATADRGATDKEEEDAMSQTKHLTDRYPDAPIRLPADGTGMLSRRFFRTDMPA
jgi:hypothetical protein